jgi:hypothetical protein
VSSSPAPGNERAREKPKNAGGPPTVSAGQTPATETAPVAQPSAPKPERVASSKPAEKKEPPKVEEKKDDKKSGGIGGAIKGGFKKLFGGGDKKKEEKKP